MTQLKVADANEKFRELAEKLVRWADYAYEHYGIILKLSVKSISLLSGTDCPGANICLARIVMEASKRRLKRGPKTIVTCFSATQERQYENTYLARLHNSKLIKNASRKEILRLLLEAVPFNLACFRWHVAGDFRTVQYLRAAVDLAVARPHTLFYAYTKSLHHLKTVAESTLVWPQNFRVVMSVGGKYDEMIPELKALYGFRTATIVMSYEEAAKMKLKVDHDDSLAALGTEDFALLIHGGQEKGSEAGKAIQLLKKETGFTGYGRAK
jgi:hypothetical protein